MRGIVLALAMVPGAAAADWVTLTSDAEITEALSNRVVAYDALTTQSFGASGATLYVTERVASGRWAARGGQYCSVWPPSDVWSCFDFAVNGDRVRFTGSDRSVSEGVFTQ